MPTENNQLGYTYLTPASDLYTQAVRLRYQIFFAPQNLSMDSVGDDLEDTSHHLAAHFESLLVGYGRLSVVNGEAQLSQMVVDEAYQGQGIGAELVQRLISQALSLGAHTIYLNARITAIDFYTRLGFAAEGDEFPSAKTGLPHQRMVIRGI